MKTILVPTDFSDISLNAAHYAADMALDLEADLILVHVLPRQVMVLEVPIPIGNDAEAFNQAEQSMIRTKEALQRYTGHKLNIISQVNSGTFLEQMRNLVKDKSPFAVIMGTTGAGATETLFLGSYTLIAIKNLTCPVIVVPSGQNFKQVTKIGLACDMKNVDETVPFKAIRSILEHFKAVLKVLYVSKPGEKMYPEVLQQTKFIQNNLEHLHPEIHIATNENVIEGINEFIRKHEIGLLLMIPKDYGFFKTLFHTSVTKRMIRTPDAPIMIIHQ